MKTRQELAPFEVDCYAHNQWTDGAIKNYADDVMAAARALVAEFAKHAKPWCCGVVGTVVIEADEAVQS